MHSTSRFGGRREQSAVPFLMLGSVFYWLMTGVCALSCAAIFLADEENQSDTLLAIGGVVAFVTVFCCFGATCFTLHTIRECNEDQLEASAVPLVLVEDDGSGAPLITASGDVA
jgi:hypothetical protein